MNLLKTVERMEMYDQRKEIVDALHREDFAAALEGCKAAMRQAHYRAKYNCAPIGPMGHVRNFEALRRFRQQLVKCARPDASGDR
jgi:hypothetical protein